MALGIAVVLVAAVGVLGVRARAVAPATAAAQEQPASVA
jgi:hypothetical protein